MCRGMRRDFALIPCILSREDRKDHCRLLEKGYIAQRGYGPLFDNYPLQFTFQFVMLFKNKNLSSTALQRIFNNILIPANRIFLQLVCWKTSYQIPIYFFFRVRKFNHSYNQIYSEIQFSQTKSMKYYDENQNSQPTSSHHRKIKKDSSKIKKHSIEKKCSSQSGSEAVKSKESLQSTASVQSGHYKFQVGQMLDEKYKIVKLLGDGTFGRVVQAQYKNKLYAIKIIRPVQKFIESAKTERDIVKAINNRDKNDEEGIVRYKHSFYHHHHFCMVFKPLGRSLYDIIKMNEFRGFEHKSVQSFFKQLLRTIGFLHRIGYTHTDLKPENILLENPQLIKDTSRQIEYWIPKSNKIRVIDFGGATRHDDVHSNTICTRQYRPPQVILECCQWNQIADMWSIGCIVAELITGDLLFPTHSDEQHLIMIEKNSGKFPYWMIAKTPSSLQSLFKDGVICENQAQKHLDHWQRIKGMKTIRDICGDNRVLLDLLEQCLQIDPNKRINCKKALQHQFFQGKFQ